VYGLVEEPIHEGLRRTLAWYRAQSTEQPFAHATA
jgi:hypothetical protein